MVVISAVVRAIPAGLVALSLGCGPSAPDPAPPPAPVPAAVAAPDAAPAPDASLRMHRAPEGYTTKHLDLDELDGGVLAPDNHTDLLWGDYLDRKGNPAVGWHSHDPATGNAQ